MVSFTKKEQIVILLLVIAIIILIGFNIVNRNTLEVINYNSEQNFEENADSQINQEQWEDEDKEKEARVIMVHISGQVNKPGLVILKDGDRIIDAVNKAGGLKDEADLDRINLAKKLNDEEKIYIPKIGENETIDVNTDVTMDNTQFSSVSTTQSGKININTASRNQLESLPGIGEKLAERIIQYRENKKFESIHEITSVSGIGEKRFEAIKDLITAD